MTTVPCFWLDFVSHMRHKSVWPDSPDDNAQCRSNWETLLCCCSTRMTVLLRLWLKSTVRDWLIEGCSYICLGNPQSQSFNISVLSSFYIQYTATSIAYSRPRLNFNSMVASWPKRLQCLESHESTGYKFETFARGAVAQSVEQASFKRSRVRCNMPKADVGSNHAVA